MNNNITLHKTIKYYICFEQKRLTNNGRKQFKIEYMKNSLCNCSKVPMLAIVLDILEYRAIIEQNKHIEKQIRPLYL